MWEKTKLLLNFNLIKKLSLTPFSVSDIDFLIHNLEEVNLKDDFNIEECSENFCEFVSKDGLGIIMLFRFSCVSLGWAAVEIYFVKSEKFI